MCTSNMVTHKAKSRGNSSRSASCHSYDGHDGLRNIDEIKFVNFESTELKSPPSQYKVDDVLKQIALEAGITLKELREWNEKRGKTNP